VAAGGAVGVVKEGRGICAADGIAGGISGGEGEASAGHGDRSGAKGIGGGGGNERCVFNKGAAGKGGGHCEGEGIGRASKIEREGEEAAGFGDHAQGDERVVDESGVSLKFSGGKREIRGTAGE